VLTILVVTPAVLGAQNISNSDHDFTWTSNPVWSGAAGTCVTCHTPHSTSTIAPLWNHAVSTTGYTMYASATMDATVPSYPELVSQACMGCHDGVTAVGGGNTISGAAALGKDLTSDHPISVEYDAGGSEFQTQTGGLVNSLPLYDDNGVWQVECGSCHNPHDPASALTPTNKFLRDSEATICTKCHSK
jgi:predicted CXXCH cytochrome family protein